MKSTLTIGLTGLGIILGMSSVARASQQGSTMNCGAGNGDSNASIVVLVQTIVDYVVPHGTIPNCDDVLAKSNPVGVSTSEIDDFAASECGAPPTWGLEVLPWSCQGATVTINNNNTDTFHVEVGEEYIYSQLPGTGSGNPYTGAGSGATSSSSGTPPGGGSCGLYVDATEAGGKLNIGVSPKDWGTGGCGGANTPPIKVQVTCTGNGTGGSWLYEGKEYSQVINVAGFSICTIDAMTSSPQGGSNVILWNSAVWSQTWSATDGFGKGHWHSAPPQSPGTQPQVAVPTHVHATAAGLVTWDAVPNAAYYAVLRDGTTLGFVDAGQAHSYQDTTDGKAHSYQVAAQANWVAAGDATWSARADQPPTTIAYSHGGVIWSTINGDPSATFDLYVDGALFVKANASYYYRFNPGALANNSTHSASVAAADSVGNPVSDQSAALTFTYLNAPTNLHDSAGPLTITVYWSGPVGAASYNVYRDNVVIAKQFTGTTYTDTPPDGNSHSYAVSAVAADASESALSAAIVAATVTTTTCRTPAQCCYQAGGTWDGRTCE
jgi:hypothetical protein